MRNNKRFPNDDTKNLVNIGHSSRLPYDECAYDDRLVESVGPLQYRMNTNRILNCDACLSTLGPRSGFMGYGVSMPVGNKAAVAQSGQIVDTESILSNRNVPKSKCRKNDSNPIDVTKFPVKHPRICNDYLNSMSSRLSYPAATYRDSGLNRFYNLNKNPQVNIYWDAAVNSTLEAKDNFIDVIPEMWSSYPSNPHAVKGMQPCRGYQCPSPKMTG